MMSDSHYSQAHTYQYSADELDGRIPPHYQRIPATTTHAFLNLPDETYPAAYPYPPSIFIKHRHWYLPQADVFFSIRGTLFGVHRQVFYRRSTFFRSILNTIDQTTGYPRGLRPSRPIPFDDMFENEVIPFLTFLYKPNELCANLEGWEIIK